MEGLTENEPLRRALIIASAAVLFVSTVILEPQTTADMAIVSVATAGLLVGLYLSHRAENAVAEKAEREAEILSVAPDVVHEDDELPRREPFGGED
ncbi:MAG: hypothetical protein ACOCRA_03000 [Halobacteria archaeon]